MATIDVYKRDYARSEHDYSLAFRWYVYVTYTVADTYVTVESATVEVEILRVITPGSSSSLTYGMLGIGVDIGNTTYSGEKGSLGNLYDFGDFTSKRSFTIEINETFPRGKTASSITVVSTTSGSSNILRWSQEQSRMVNGFFATQYSQDVYEKTLDIPALSSYSVSYDANGAGVSNVPSAQTKWYGETLTLSNTSPLRIGYKFLRWNTSADGSGTDYTPGASYTGNAALALYAIWVGNPTISALSIVRCDSSGTADDQGTYCKVTATWAVGTGRPGGNSGTVTGTIRPQGGSAAAFSFSSGASGTSGTAVAIVPNVDVDTQYTVAVTLTDLESQTVSRSDILTRAKFVWDIRAGGLAMGIGSAAPQSGLEVGWVAQFDENVTLLRNLIINGTISGTQFDLVSATTDIATAETGWAVSSQSAKVVGRVCMIQLAFKPSASVSANTSSTIGTIASDYRPLLRQGFADSSGTGYVSTGGSITYRNLVALTTSSTVYVALTYVK